jgi:PHD/YefM family antitoxin component YafN of YafNO toxin-antitoxin module
MNNVMFDDSIISSTELKKNQKKWFDKASKTPVSITNRNGKQFVLLNREQARELLLAKEYAEIIFKFVSDLKRESGTEQFSSAVFPWAKNLSRDDRLAFCDELILAFAELININRWLALKDTIESWKATAEALTNPKFMEVVNSKPNERKFTKIE